MEGEQSKTGQLANRVQLHRLTRQLLSLLIAFHIVAITLWVLPLRSVTGFVQRWVGPYFSLIGLRQEWQLFAPDPIASNSYVDAQVVLDNGDLRAWTFPRLEDLGFGERYSRARYRKYEGWLYRKNFAYAWPDAARYISRQFNDSTNPPRTIRLIRHWAKIPPIASASDSPPKWQSTVFFVYQIPPGGLE